MATRKIARRATTGQFISIREAKRRPATSVIETVKITSRTLCRRCRRRC
jgi:hypothetical protein